MATNISHWLKVQSRWFKNDIFVKKCILISFWIFKYCFFIPSHFITIYCAIFYSLDAGFFQYHPGVKKFGSRSGLTFCRGLIWVQTVCKGYQQISTKQFVDTFWLKPWLKLILFGSNFFHLAKVLATTNSEPA